jgi:agmatine/peptidylarginine deiminase
VHQEALGGFSSYGAEFQDQAGILLGGNELVTHHPEAFVKIMESLLPATRVICILADEQQRIEAVNLLGVLAQDPNCSLVVVPIDTMWIRDYGPLAVRAAGGMVLAVDADCSLPEEGVDIQDFDNELPSRLAQVMQLPCLKVPLRLQGGNFLTNGAGLIVTSEAMTRNNGEDGREESQVYQQITEIFGCSQWLVLEPLIDEPTEHVDMYIAFLAENVVVVGQYDRTEDPENADLLDRAAARLARVQTPKGPMRVHRIPMPPRLDGVWRTYTNVIFANGRLLVPSYSGAPQELEEQAMDLYRRLLPGWEVIGIDCEEMIPLGGALHCISMNLPGYVRIPRQIRDIFAPGIGSGDLMPAGRSADHRWDSW